MNQSNLQARINSLQLREELEGENIALNCLISLLILEEHQTSSTNQANTRGE
jgi:hypothetical protein